MGNDWEIINIKIIHIPTEDRCRKSKPVNGYIATISNGKSEFKAFGLTKVDAAVRAFKFKDFKNLDGYCL